MADSAKEKRLALNDAKAARHSLSRIIRMRLRGELESDVYRDLVYGLNALLGFEKLQKETELERRLAGLESKKGQIVLNISPGEAAGLDLTPEERDLQILELLQKGGYIEAPAPPGDTLETEAVPLAVEAPHDTVPAIPELQEQPQPRRLKL
jgi:hypothetical protein